MSIDT